MYEFDAEFKRLAKMANRRMRDLERAGYRTKAYEGVQSWLKLAGRPSRDGKYRFSETGRADYNTREGMKARLRIFIRADTSSVAKTQRLRNRIWNSANENNRLEERGVTREEYFNIWSSLPDDKRERMFSSDVYISVVSAYNKKMDDKGVDEENRLSVDEIVELIQNADNYKGALKAVGLTFRDIKKASDLGEL